MDGAIVLAPDASRIARANVHLVPNPNVPTSETGTRHRTAERVARSINVPVISVSEDMSIIAVYVGDEKHQLEPIPRLLDRANQALQTLERYKERLDEVSNSLSALEVEDLVTIRDVVMLLQRTEMVLRIAEEIEGDIVELGVDGRLVRLQLEEVMAGVEDERRLVVLDYLHEENDWHLEEAMSGLGPPRHRDAARPQGRGRRAAPPRRRRPTSTPRCSPRATACWPASPACPSRSSTASSSASARWPRSCGPPMHDLDEVEGVGEPPGQGHQGRPQPPGRVEHPRPLLLTGAARRRPVGRHVASPEEPCASPCPPARPPSWPGPTASRRLGVVLFPDIMGLRPLFDDMCARLAAEHGWVVCAPEPFPGREDLDIPSRMALHGPVLRRRPAGRRPRRGRRHRLRAGRGHGLLHGRDAHVQGGGQRPLRPGGRLLRDDPAARPTGRARWPSPSTRWPRPTGARPSRSSAASTRTRPTPTWPTPRPSGSRSPATRRPTTASCTTRRAPPTGPTTRPTPGAGPSPSSPPDPNWSVSARPCQPSRDAGRSRAQRPAHGSRGRVSSRRGRG